MNHRGFFATGAAFGGLAVAMGAFAAHFFKERMPEDMLAHVETAARYQMYHALALLGVGLSAVRESTTAKVAGWSFIAGIILFSGSLYLLAMTGHRWLGAITPFGGVAFLVGWASLAVTGRGLRDLV